MQLESSVFGVCIIQIKPALERLLNLPDGSLTKEIQLTQDLMQLFQEYQIPSDLLSYDGDPTLTQEEKLQYVKKCAKGVMDVIDKEKQKQLEAEKQKRDMRNQEYAPYSRPSASPSEAPSSTSTSYQTFAAQSRKLHGSAESLGGLNTMESNVYATSGKMTDARESFSSAHAGTRKYSSKPQTERLGGRSQSKANHRSSDTDASMTEDFTLVPKILDNMLQSSDGALKSTTIQAGTSWYRTRQENLLLTPKKDYMATEVRESEKNQAMDLLTAISRSGSLPIDSSELHVVVALTHCFEQDVMNTVYQDNINPITKVESSLLLLGTTIHSLPKENLLAAPADEKVAVEEKKET
jgi:hypothetical protein